MKLKILILLLTCIGNVHAQSIWSYCLDWSAGDPISFTNIGTVTLTQSPNNQSIKACSGSTIDFSARFADLDDAKCPKGTFKKQFPLADYNIKFISSTPDAVFQNGSTTIEVGAQTIIQENNPFCPGETFDVFVSRNASLTILPSWSGTNIDVTVEVTDLGAALPPCHTGSPIDPSNSYTWSIVNATNLPTKLVRVGSSPPENTWTSYSPPKYDEGGVTFTYRAMPDAPPAYSDLIIREEFPTLSAGGIFTMNDLTTAWKNMHPTILDADAAAQVIFQAGNPNSFALDSTHEFDDYHAGWTMDVSLIPSIFTTDAINNKRVGYKYDQTYSVCSNNLGTAEIWRRIDKSHHVELKKKHNL